MAEVPVERRFRGSVRLATLHLWRVAKSTDLERCFKEARDLRMINQENEDFIRRFGEKFSIHYTTEEGAAHTWDFWDRQIEKVLAWLNVPEAE